MAEQANKAEPAGRAEQVRCLLFVYGTLRQGETQHGLLASARLLRLASTPPAFYLVEVAPYAALDVERQVPLLFTRETIELTDGTSADAYLLTSEQVRGRRRLAHGDWKQRFSRNVSSRAGGAWVAWSRGRWSK